MASAGILLFVFTVSYITGSKAFVTVQCKPETTVQYGQKSLLECVVTTKQEATDLQIRVVTWKKEGVDDALLVFNRGKTTHLPGYSFAEPSWNDRNMNVSLLITNNAALQDEGVYTCVVMTYMGSASNRTSLKVTAKYRVPTIKAIPESINRNTEGTLVCTSDGGYPEGQLRWFDQDGMEWTKSAKMEVQKTENGLSHLTSRLTLLQGSIFSQYTCVVFNASGEKVDETIFVVPEPRKSPVPVPGGTDPTSKIVAPVVVIGSLIVGLLLAVLLYRKRTQRDHHVPRDESDAEEGDYQDTDKECHNSLA